MNFCLSPDYQRRVILEGAGCEPVVGQVLETVDWSRYPGLAHLKNAYPGVRIEYLRPLTQRDRNRFDLQYQAALKRQPLLVP